jgi:hypothetical protein
MISNLLFRLLLRYEKRHSNFDPNLTRYPAYHIKLTWTITKGDDKVIKEHSVTLNYIRNQLLQYVNLRRNLANFIDSLIVTIDSVENS